MTVITIGMFFPPSAITADITIDMFFPPSPVTIDLFYPERHRVPEAPAAAQPSTTFHAAEPRRSRPRRPLVPGEVMECRILGAPVYDTVTIRQRLCTYINHARGSGESAPFIDMSRNIGDAEALDAIFCYLMDWGEPFGLTFDLMNPETSAEDRVARYGWIPRADR